MAEPIKSPDCRFCEFRSILFDNLEQDELDKLNACKSMFNFNKGEVISEQGQLIDSVIYLHEGLVKLHKTTPGGQNQIVSIAKPFDFVGLLSVFSSETFVYSITAIEKTSVCFIKKKCLEEEILRNGKFALDILQRMSRITDELIENKFAMSNKNLRGRIAYILLDFAENIYNKNVFNLPVSRKEIAELIDMRTENVIRILSEFRKDGIIRINGHEIEILNTDLLKRIKDSG